MRSAGEMRCKLCRHQQERVLKRLYVQMLPRAYNHECNALVHIQIPRAHVFQGCMTVAAVPQKLMQPQARTKHE